jgi:site-specific DNA recombinase
MTAEEQDITRGKYRGHYLIYNRKSTDDTVNQKNSIKYQKAENIRFAVRERIPIASLTMAGFATEGIVSERHSGFKENGALSFGRDNSVQYRIDRPKFHRLVQLLSRRNFKGVIFLCWDRASRNRGDDTVLRKLMKAGIDIRFTLAQYDKSSAGELHMDIDGMFAEHHSRVTQEKVSLTFRNKRAQGICTYRAPVGYLNLGSMEHKPFDEVRAPILREIFAQAAAGQWSLSDLARLAVERGLTMPPMRRRRSAEEMLAEEEDDLRVEIAPISRLPTFNGIHKILTNPFYTGKIRGNDGAWVPSTSHQALVSEQVFRLVQDQLHRRNTSAHYVSTIDYPLRRAIRCATCYRVYTPYAKKGITYYGARCARPCANPRKSFNFDFIASRVGAFIAQLAFTDDELARIDAATNTDIALLDSNRLERLEQAARRKKKMHEDIAYLNDNKLALLRAGVYTAEGLVAEEARLNLELDTLGSEDRDSGCSMQETIADARTLSELLKNVAQLYYLSSPREKEPVIAAIFSELTINGDTAEYKCKNGFKALAHRFIASGDPTGWLSELQWQHPYILESIDSLKTVLAPAEQPTNVLAFPARRHPNTDDGMSEPLAA